MVLKFEFKHGGKALLDFKTGLLWKHMQRGLNGTVTLKPWWWPECWKLREAARFRRQRRGHSCTSQPVTSGFDILPACLKN